MAKPNFLCEHCSATVDYDAPVCPSCSRIFSGVRCPECDFKGLGRLFLNGCPQCGYAIKQGLRAAAFEIFSMDDLGVADTSTIHKETKRFNRRYRMNRLHWRNLNYHHGIAVLIGLILLAALFYVLL